MATEDEPKSFCIFESRNATMLCSKKGEKPKLRIARFLKPCARSINQTSRFPLVSDQTRSQKGQEGHSNPKVLFKGWKKPQRKWGDWFESLTGKHAFTWQKAGICDALLSSLYEIRRNQSLILELVKYWCPQTNTFVFPWGEATITLEDVMILGGFSVLGEPVTLPLSKDLLAMEAKLVELRRKMWTRSQGCWIKFFVEEEESHELEHVGFLSLWLSRFVFPSLSDSNIGRDVFPIAIHLSQGTTVALAPAVLASLYESLRLLKQQVVSSVVELVTVLGPFQIVHQWAIERFPILGPKFPKELKPGEPRAARWHKLNSDAGVSLISSTLKSACNFKWRPFVADLKNWCFVSHYKDNEQLVVNSSNSAEELRSFGLCLCADELVGLHCIEKYMPYRVAMQFGMDQHLPGEFVAMQPRCRENFSFYVPAKCYMPGVSLEYFNWWQGSKLIQEKKILKPERKPYDSNLSCPNQNATALDKTCMVDILTIAKYYCEEETHASTNASENNSERKLSTKEEIKQVENNSPVVDEHIAVQEAEVKGSTCLEG